MKEKEFVHWVACTAEDHKPRSEGMLNVPMPPYPRSLLSIYSQVISMGTVHTAAAVRQSRAGGES